MFKSRDIEINTTTLGSGKHSISIDFTPVTEILANNYFELHLNDSVVKLYISSDMTISDFAALVERNCNADFDFYKKALASSSSNILNIATRDTDSMEIFLDYSKER